MKKIDYLKTKFLQTKKMTSLSQWELLPSGSLRTDEDEDEETELEIQDPIITILRSNNNYENVIFVTEGSGQVFIKSVFPELEVIGTLLIPEEPLVSALIGVDPYICRCRINWTGARVALKLTAPSTLWEAIRQRLYFVPVLAKNEFINGSKNCSKY